MAKVEISGTIGVFCISGTDAEAVRDAVEMYVRGVVALNLDMIDDDMENCVEMRALSEQIMNDHRFLRNSTYAEINRMLHVDLGWETGPEGDASTEIKEIPE